MRSFLDLIQRDLEKLFSLVDKIQPHSIEFFMQRIFERRNVLTKNHGVDIERERDACIAQFLDAIHRGETAGHADLIDIR